MSTTAIIENYKKWYSENIKLYEEVITENGTVFEVHVPAYNQNGEGISFYISKQGEIIKVSDLGYTMSNLNMSGAKISKAKVDKIKEMLYYYNISFYKNEIYLECVEELFNQRFQNLIYAIIQINFLCLKN